VSALNRPELGKAVALAGEIRAPGAAGARTRGQVCSPAAIHLRSAVAMRRTEASETEIHSAEFAVIWQQRFRDVGPGDEELAFPVEGGEGAAPAR